MRTIKIAPGSEEITRNGNVFSCEFNNMKIRWEIEADCNEMDEETENKLKKWLSCGIAMSGKLWQLPYMLNDKLPFSSKIFVNDKEVEYPKN